MMEVVADLVRRGIISPDAANNFAQRLQAIGGQQQGAVEDRRGEYNPYARMLAGNQNIRDLMRIIFAGKPPNSGYPVKDTSDSNLAGSKLQKDAGFEDIGKE